MILLVRATDTNNIMYYQLKLLSLLICLYSVFVILHSLFLIIAYAKRVYNSLSSRINGTSNIEMQSVIDSIDKHNYIYKLFLNYQVMRPLLRFNLIYA